MANRGKDQSREALRGSWRGGRTAICLAVAACVGCYSSSGESGDVDDASEDARPDRIDADARPDGRETESGDNEDADDDTGDEPALLETLQVTPASAGIVVGSTQPYLAFGTYADGLSREVTDEVTWRSSDPSVATIDAHGVAEGAATGETTVTAELDGITSNDATLSVTGDDPMALDVAPMDAMALLGETVQFEATLTWMSGMTTDATSLATWHSSDPTVASISNAAGSEGLATTISPGRTEIWATWAGMEPDPRALLTVLGPVSLVAITIEPASATLWDSCGGVVGPPVPLTATAVFSDGTTTDVTTLATWRSSDETIVTVDASGAASAVPGGGSGTVEITATYEGIESSPAIVTVLPATCVSAILVAPATAVIVPGATQSFTATAVYEDGRSADVTATATWSSSSPAVAVVDAVGVATGASCGTVTIWATYGTISGTASLVVACCDPFWVHVEPPAATIRVGETVGLAAVATTTCGDSYDATAMARWETSDATVAGVAGGLVDGRSAGTATITATTLPMTSDTSIVTVVE